MFQERQEKAGWQALAGDSSSPDHLSSQGPGHTRGQAHCLLADQGKGRDPGPVASHPGHRSPALVFVTGQLDCSRSGTLLTFPDLNRDNFKIHIPPAREHQSKQGGHHQAAYPRRALSPSPLGGTTVLPGTRGWGSGACGDAENTGGSCQPGPSRPQRLQPRFYPCPPYPPPGIPRTLQVGTQPLPHQPQRDTHRPLGCGGSAGSASSPPGWDSGWRPGVGQLTSMWSRSYQNLHCSQKFHPDRDKEGGRSTGTGSLQPLGNILDEPQGPWAFGGAPKGRKAPPNLAVGAGLLPLPSHGSGSGSGSCRKPGLRAGAVCN